RRSTSDSPPARAVSTRASVQILSGVLLRAESGRVHLAATDMPPALRHRPPRRARRRRPLARAQPARADAGAGRRLTSRGRRPEPRHRAGGGPRGNAQGRASYRPAWLSPFVGSVTAWRVGVGPAGDFGKRTGRERAVETMRPEVSPTAA